MASYATLGLLKGLGQGMSTMGESMFKQALLEAENKRQMHLEEIKYQRSRADKLADEERAVTRAKALKEWESQHQADAKSAERGRVAELLGEHGGDHLAAAKAAFEAGDVELSKSVLGLAETQKKLTDPVETKMNPAVKMEYEALNEQVKSIYSSLSKDTIDPDMRVALLEKASELNARMSALTGRGEPVSGGEAGGTFDSLLAQLKANREGTGDAAEPATTSSRADVPGPSSKGDVTQTGGAGAAVGLINKGGERTEPELPKYSGNVLSSLAERFSASASVDAARALNEAAKSGRAMSTSDINDVVEGVRAGHIKATDLHPEVLVIVEKMLSR